MTGHRLPEHTDRRATDAPGYRSQMARLVPLPEDPMAAPARRSPETLADWFRQGPPIAAMADAFNQLADAVGFEQARNTWAAASQLAEPQR